MKAVELEILGQKRYLCNSVRVTKAIVQRFGSTEKMRDTLTGGNTMETLEAIVWLLRTLLDGGYRYAQLNGLACPPPPSEDDLMDGYSLDDIGTLQGLAVEAMTSTSKADVEAEAKTSKNGETTVGQ